MTPRNETVMPDRLWEAVEEITELVIFNDVSEAKETLRAVQNIASKALERLESVE